MVHFVVVLFLIFVPSEQNSKTEEEIEFKKKREERESLLHSYSSMYIIDNT